MRSIAPDWPGERSAEVQRLALTVVDNTNDFGFGPQLSKYRPRYWFVVGEFGGAAGYVEVHDHHVFGMHPAIPSRFGGHQLKQRIGSALAGRANIVGSSLAATIGAP